MKPDTRVWMYRDGESRLFNHPGEVPLGEGWVDTPAKVKVGAAEKKPELPKVLVAPVPVDPDPANGEDGGDDDAVDGTPDDAPLPDDIEALRTIARAMGLRFPPKIGAEKLKARIEEARL